MSEIKKVSAPSLPLDLNDEFGVSRHITNSPSNVILTSDLTIQRVWNEVLALMELTVL